MTRGAFAVMLVLVSPAIAQETARDEVVDLTAPEKRIVESSYHDSEAVVLSGSAGGGWHLYAGAAIDAERIDLKMTNIRGVVRFRADWGRISNILAAWKAARPSVPP